MHDVGTWELAVVVDPLLILDDNLQERVQEQF